MQMTVANLQLNKPVVDLHLLFVRCVKTVQFNKFVTCTQQDGNNQIQQNNGITKDPSLPGC